MKSRIILLAAAALGTLLIFTGCDSSAELPAGESIAPAQSASEPAEQTTAAEETAMPTETQDTMAEPTVTPNDVFEVPDASDDTAQTGTTATPDQQYMTLTLAGTITQLDDESDIVYITEQGGNTDDPTASVGAVEVDDCIIIDGQTGQEIDDDMLSVGDSVTAFIGYAMSRSIPPQAPCYAIITNVPTDGTGVTYVRALEVSSESDAISVLNQNADMFITIPQTLGIEVFDENGQTLSPSDIKPGSRMVVWYDQLTRSIPPQAIATKVVVDLDD